MKTFDEFKYIFKVHFIYLLIYNKHNTIAIAMTLTSFFIIMNINNSLLQNNIIRLVTEHEVQ